MTYREAVFDLMVLGTIPAVLFIVFHTANVVQERGWRNLFTIVYIESVSWVAILGGVFAWYVFAIATGGGAPSRPWNREAYILLAWLILLDFALWLRYCHWLWYAWRRKRLQRHLSE